MEQKTRRVDHEVILCNLLQVKCSEELIEYFAKKSSLCNDTDNKTHSLICEQSFL